MIRLVVAALILCGLAFALAWLVDHPGSIEILWFGHVVETSVAAAILAVIAVSAALAGLAWLVRLLVRSPRLVRRKLGERAHDRGMAALSRGLIAIGSGDAVAAKQAAGEAERHVGYHPLTLLLRSQAAQLSGEREAAVSSFRTMLERKDTAALGLRGLYVEARRDGDHEAARRHAEAALAERPRLSWAAHATLAYQAGSHDWDGALATVRQQAAHRLIGREKAKRLKAVLLTGRAIDSEAHDRAQARALALEAHRDAPELVPAALLAARLLAETGEVARASRVIETSWRLSPHPELAEAYAHARLGDSAQDRLKRARVLAKLAPEHRESAFALAAAHMEARDFAAARSVLEGVTGAPTRRHCLLFAHLADAEGKDGEAREWFQRAAIAPPDAAWMADGMVCERWLPVSPLSGDVDAFVWQVPSQTPGLPSTLVMPNVPEAPVEGVARLMDARMPEAAPISDTEAVLVPVPAPKPPFIPDDPGPQGEGVDEASPARRPAY